MFDLEDFLAAGHDAKTAMLDDLVARRQLNEAIAAASEPLKSQALAAVVEWRRLYNEHDGKPHGY